MSKGRVVSTGSRVKGNTRKMKDSGVKWIGEIPEDWGVLPLAQFFNERNEKVSDYDFEPLSVTKKGIVKQLNETAKSSNHDNRKKVCVNDFVINSRSDRKQSCGISPYTGSVSVINIVLKNRILELSFVKYLLDNYGFAEEFYRWGTGIVADLWSTRYDKMKRIMLPITSSKNEQQKIADFLDEKVSLIDDTIEKTKQSIEDYKKYKQALITETVTKGLNPDVKMKNSGIEWIGEVPEHWEIRKIKYSAKLRNEKSLYDKEKDIFVGLENIESYSGKYVLSESSYNNGFYDSFKKGDVLFNKLRPYLAKCLLATFDGFCTGEMLIISSFMGIKKYLFYYLLSSRFIDVLNSSTYGAKMPRASWEFIKELPITVPSKEEQQQIADYLDGKCLEIDKVISEKGKLIKDLEAYKKSLIYEYVTGKKQV